MEKQKERELHTKPLSSQNSSVAHFGDATDQFINSASAHKRLCELFRKKKKNDPKVSAGCALNVTISPLEEDV